MRCPVCENKSMNHGACSQCGYKAYQDPVGYRTLMPVNSQNAAPYLESRKRAAEMKDGGYRNAGGEKTVIAPPGAERKNDGENNSIPESVVLPLDDKEDETDFRTEKQEERDAAVQTQAGTHTKRHSAFRFAMFVDAGCSLACGILSGVWPLGLLLAILYVVAAKNTRGMQQPIPLFTVLLSLAIGVGSLAEPLVGVIVHFPFSFLYCW